jgi:hypothetical protein
MTAIINKYFDRSPGNEQSLVNALIKESIQVQGRQYWYLPRNSQVRDIILGEDVLSSFSLAIPLEMYMVDAQGFQGQREMFTKFGLQINNSYRLVVSVDRWVNEVQSQFDGSITNGEASFTKSNYLRPGEGDLIYDPLTRFLMVIKFVDNDQEFYTLGKNYVYYLSCEAFMYQNEMINTQVPEIDSFNELSKDILIFQLLTEALEPIVQENGDFILQELEQQPTRDIEVDYSTPSSSINTTIKNPFSL